MIKTLKVKNVALMEDAVIEFCDGLNIISGETGAGKSVLLDALNLALGAKADKTLIKSGEESLSVSLTLLCDENNSNLKAFFENNDIDYDGCIKLNRKIKIDGKSEMKLNGEIVPLNLVKNLSQLLVNMHGQNENLVLLNKDNQLKLLDGFVDFDKTELVNLYDSFVEINNKILALDKDEDIRIRELDLLNYQINEIESAKLIDGEEEELTIELNLLKNAEKISDSLNNIKELFEYGNVNILSLLNKAEYCLNTLNNLNSAENLSERLESANIEINDIYAEILNKYDLNFDVNRLNFIDERLDLYKKLHRKYGVTFEEINLFLENAKNKRDLLLNYEEELSVLNKQKNLILNNAYIVCEKLSELREKSAIKLENLIKNELSELSMKNAEIKFEISKFNKENFENVFTKNGANTVEILFSANLGESVKPLNLVASGGEISRLMLAIKTISSKFDGVMSVVFDEIDSGISGEASVSTSKKLAKISKNSQVIAISHLFQICAMADRNILVKKLEENGKTNSYAVILKEEEAVLELCRFLSVGNVTDAVIKHAKEVKQFCDDYKKSINNNC